MKTVKEYLWVRNVRAARDHCKAARIHFSPLMFFDNAAQLAAHDFSTYQYPVIFFQPDRISYADVIATFEPKYFFRPSVVLLKVKNTKKEYIFQQVIDDIWKQVSVSNTFHADLAFTHVSMSNKTVEVSLVWTDDVDQTIGTDTQSFYIDPRGDVYKDQVQRPQMQTIHISGNASWTNGSSWATPPNISGNGGGASGVVWVGGGSGGGGGGGGGHGGASAGPLSPTGVQGGCGISSSQSIGRGTRSIPKVPLIVTHVDDLTKKPRKGLLAKAKALITIKEKDEDTQSN